ncbi:glycoside hydrolase family 26 protein [Streptomyces sp. NBC_01262]|uniref:glycoside hydrolase family 26 protein n=1 Tax=Streptomyces sp. NBC_01262 TaxID=2903803 RepID=UPI002E30714D|nr:glycosyl hydrolase [Streptomyces sp. NBC_01262]
MAVNVVLLGTLSYGVYAAVLSNAHSGDYIGLGAQSDSQGLINRLKGTSGSSIPTKEQFLNPDGTYFGAATFKAPYNAKEIDQLATDAGGIRPTMASYFLSWNEKFNPGSITAAYSHRTLPVLTWEPWRGGQQNPNGLVLKTNIDQPEYQLSDIIDGTYDSYITKTAKSIAKAKLPLVLRFAHEMNGVWYPWSERVNGNKKGEYVKAWRHVHDLFDKAGASNVIWVWAPNIVRPAPNVKLKLLYPGDAYVDWVGMTGYGVRETSPAVTFGATIKQIRTFTDKPIIITETGAQIDSRQLGWVNALFPWLKENPDVIGFIWTQKDKKTGAGANWRFTSSAAEQQAFQKGLATLDLATGEQVGASSRPSSSSSSGKKS